jgi:uncharacterized protein
LRRDEIGAQGFYEYHPPHASQAAVSISRREATLKAQLVHLIESYARSAMQNDARGAHVFEHVERVRQLCLVIGQREQADLEILEAAALLHDIGRPQETTTGVSHAIVGAKMATKFLSTTAFPSSKILQVASAIRTHRFSENLTPESLEGQILSDADKLDAMGAVGLARAIEENLARGRTFEGMLEHVSRKLLNLRDRIYTRTARQLAGPRHGLLVHFMRQVAQEYLTIGIELPPVLQPFAEVVDRRM